MNRLRSFILTSTDRPRPSRVRLRRPDRVAARKRTIMPVTNAVRLRGRDISARQRALFGWRGVLPDVLLTLLFFTLSFAITIQHVQDTSTHPDETRWMNRSYYARELGDPFGPDWQEYVTTIGQPPLGSIVMGIGLWVQGHDLEPNGVWDFAYGRDWNERMGAIPSDEDRFAGRRTNVVIGALVTGAIFVLGRLMTNRVGGSIAALFIAWHPLHVLLSTQALSDQTLALLLALIFIAGWAFAKHPTWTRAIILGILLGLGGSVKLTPLLLAGPLAVFGLIRWWMSRDAEARQYAFKMLAQPVIAFATFVLSYPYLWPNPITRTWKLYAFRAGEMEEQSAAWPETAVADPLDALSRFGLMLTTTHSTSQHFLETFYGWFGIDRTPVGLDYIPAVAGLVLLLWWVARNGFWTPAAMVALLMGVEAGTLVFGMKTDFYRYHLPIVVIMAGCIGVSTGALWSAGVRAFRRWQPLPYSQPVPSVARRGARVATEPQRAPAISTSAQGELSK